MIQALRAVSSLVPPITRVTVSVMGSLPRPTLPARRSVSMVLVILGLLILLLVPLLIFFIPIWVTSLVLVLPRVSELATLLISPSWVAGLDSGISVPVIINCFPVLGIPVRSRVLPYFPIKEFWQSWDFP